MARTLQVLHHVSPSHLTPVSLAVLQSGLLPTAFLPAHKYSHVPLHVPFTGTVCETFRRSLEHGLQYLPLCSQADRTVCLCRGNVLVGEGRVEGAALAAQCKGRTMVGATAEGDNKRKRYTKSTLPTKLCAQCRRPMNWRKKWEKVWDEVKFCSERCRREAKAGGQSKGVPHDDALSNSELQLED